MEETQKPGPLKSVSKTSKITSFLLATIFAALICTIHFEKYHKVNQGETLYEIGQKYNNPKILTFLLNPAYWNKDSVSNGDKVRILADSDNINLHKIDETCYYNLKTGEYKIEVSDSVSGEKYWKTSTVSDEVRNKLSQLLESEIPYELRQYYNERNNWI